MGVETASTVADLNDNWPLASDPKSEGDDHLRLIKKVMKDNLQPANTSETEDDTVSDRVVTPSTLVPYVEGYVSDALSDPSTFGALEAANDLSDLNDASTALDNLGVTSATKGMVENSAFPLLSTGDDIDTTGRTPGWYRVDSNASNRPFNRTGILHAISSPSQTGEFQVFYPLDGSIGMFFRYHDGSWTNWQYVDTIKYPLGQFQEWQDVSASRSAGTSYQNTTGSAIQVFIKAGTSSSWVEVSTDNSTWVRVGQVATTNTTTAHFIVPDDHYYRVENSSAVILEWTELR